MCWHPSAVTLVPPDQCFTSSPPLILTVTPLEVGILVPFLLVRRKAKRLKLLVTGSHWWEAPGCSGQKVAFRVKPTVPAVSFVCRLE